LKSKEKSIKNLRNPVFMNRAYYSNSISEFIGESNITVLGELSLNHSNRTLEDLQKNAWVKQIEILKSQLVGLNGRIYFEFAIPRMGKRVDNVLIVNDVIFIIEFKVGDNNYDKYAIDQVIDYTIDLKNFHEGSHQAKLIPILVATNAKEVDNSHPEVYSLCTAAKANACNLNEILRKFINPKEKHIDYHLWESSIYKPTPTIIEAAQALYKGHNVKEITRSDSGAINLSKTAYCINEIVELSKEKNQKSICFVTGVPGAGKTLAGLNIANERMNSDKDEHAVFLSGNGPLVDVLREALTRDEVSNARNSNTSITKKQAAIKANAFIQNIHHFRDDNLISDKSPVEKVVVFDEAQRAWTENQLNSFMKSKKGKENFNKSEPEFLIEVMNRHNDWCTVVCLIGGGQEINTGEAGLEEWLISIRKQFSNWNIYYSSQIVEDNNYVKSNELKTWLEKIGNIRPDLHLAVSVRSFRSEKVSEFIHELLEVNKDNAKNLFNRIIKHYPLAITRDYNTAKEWLKTKAKGNERIGILVSSGARRLRPLGIDSENGIRSDSGKDKISHWFLNNKDDIRSSSFLELPATQFAVQGLELDWVCLGWGGDLSFNGNTWEYRNFAGNRWNKVNIIGNQEYLVNSYRVLLTRARQGMVIFIPHGSTLDKTRDPQYYDNTYKYLKDIGLVELD
jgi:DUF2075 family protein